jgi:hypothetical protein
MIFLPTTRIRLAEVSMGGGQRPFDATLLAGWQTQSHPGPLRVIRRYRVLTAAEHRETMERKQQTGDPQERSTHDEMV